MKPYLALDIETTGLDLHKSQVLQIAAIYVDGETRKEFNVLVDNGSLVYGEPFALQLNAWILKELCTRDSSYRRLKRGEAIQEFYGFLLECSLKERITVAGKNVAGFDLQILRNQGFDVTKFAHRTIDIGSLYLPDYGYVPSLSEINTKLGRKPVSHNALEDCEDVIAAIHHKLGGK